MKFIFMVFLFYIIITDNLIIRKNNIMDINKMPQFNLFEKHKNDVEFLDKIKAYKIKRKLINTHPKFKIDDVITFTSGFNDDIRYTTKIFGFNDEEEIYVIWDCYWFPLTDDKTRNIILNK